MSTELDLAIGDTILKQGPPRCAWPGWAYDHTDDATDTRWFTDGSALMSLTPPFIDVP